MKTPKNNDLGNQVAHSMGRCVQYTEKDTARWDKLQDVLENFGEEEEGVSALVIAEEEPPWTFLESNDLFGKLPEEELSQFTDFGEFVTLQPGEWLFRGGEDCDTVMGIRSGILEISREEEGKEDCAALLGVGEVLGMLGALTSGRHRSSARFPEGGEILVMDAATFDAALDSLPKLSAALTRSMAKRLIGAVQRGDMSRAKKRHLEGSLAHFDLSTILQSLFSSDSCGGVLRIMSAEGATLGEIDVAEGHVLACNAGDLRDSEAFQHLFIADNSTNRFVFQESDIVADPDRTSGEIANISGAGLLMDCARIADELERVRSGPLGDPNRVLERGQKPRRWEDKSTKEIARAIWLFFEEKHTVKDVITQGFGCENDVTTVLLRFVEDGHLI